MYQTLFHVSSFFRVLHTKTTQDIETQLGSRNLERNLLVNFTPL